MKKNLLFLSLLSAFAAQAATFESVATGNWSNSATWTMISGTDADGYPDSDDITTISAGTTVTATTTVQARSLTINGSFDLNGQKVILFGNFTNNGSIAGTGLFFFRGAGTISSTTTIFNQGNWFFESPGVIIAAGTTINKGGYFVINSTANVTNLGNITLSGGSFEFRGGTWINGVNSSLVVQRNMYGTGTLDASANPNTVTYRTVNNTTIKSATYHHLSLQPGGSSTTIVKTLEGAVTVNGNLTLGNLIQLDVNNFNITLGGNWINTGNRDLLNAGTLTLNGSGTQTIGRVSLPERFNNVVLNGTGTVQLGNGLSGYTGSTVINGNLTINSGTLDVSSSNFPLYIVGNWINNGGTFNPRAGTVFLTGTATQSVGKPGAVESFFNLTKNSTGAVTLNSDIAIGGAFSFTAGSFDVSASNFTLGVAGNWTVSGGTFIPQQGTVIFYGSALQTIGGTSSISFFNITINNSAGVNLGVAHSLQNTLTVNAGDFNTNGNTFTLLSTASGTARVAPVPTGASLSGTTWIMQRYLPSQAAYWDCLAPPLDASNVLDWDNELYMSGVGGADGIACCPTFYSVREYWGTENNVTSTSYGLLPGRGLEVWLETDNETYNGGVLDTRGIPVYGDQTIGVPTSGYYLVGNPFPSQIDWDLVARTNVNQTIYILDETLQNYASYNGSSGTGKLSGSGGVINSTQGFFIESTAAGSIVIEEVDKTAATTQFVKQARPQDYTFIKLTNSANTYGAENMLFFHERASEYRDELDGGYLSSPNQKAPGLKMYTTDGKELLVNALSSLEKSHSVKIQVVPSVIGTYTLSFKGMKELDRYSCVYIKDETSGTVTNLKRSDSYSFFVTDLSKTPDFTLYFDESSEEDICARNASAPSDVFKGVKINGTGSQIVAEMNFESESEVIISVFNTMGQQVSSDVKLRTTNETRLISVPDDRGIYLVKVSVNGTVKTYRVSN